MFLYRGRFFISISFGAKYDNPLSVYCNSSNEQEIRKGLTIISELVRQKHLLQKVLKKQVRKKAIQVILLQEEVIVFV
jgi:hypothetical protein